MKKLWERWAPLTGLLAVACSLVGVMLALDNHRTRTPTRRSSPTSPTTRIEYMG